MKTTFGALVASVLFAMLVVSPVYAQQPERIVTASIISSHRRGHRPR